MNAQPLICVRDVEASSQWYRKLLGLVSDHGGKEYERLLAGEKLVLQLHRFGVEHDHGPIANPNLKPYGNGLLLWFELDDFDDAMKRLAELNPEMVLPRHRNPADMDGGPNAWECWFKDPDGYTVVISSPLGTADGTWKPPGKSAG